VEDSNDEEDSDEGSDKDSEEIVQVCLISN
jgi:hypothetical protein